MLNTFGAVVENHSMLRIISTSTNIYIYMAQITPGITLSISYYYWCYMG